MKLSMLMLGVEDLEKSVAFYRDVAGVPPKSRVEQFAFLDTGQVTLILSQPLGNSRKPLGGAMEAIFAAASVRASHREIAGRGAHFVNQPHEVSPGSWAATFQDLDGHLLTLFGPE